MSWEEYSERVALQWQALLNSPEAHLEANIHRFLERHPCMIPGVISVTGPSGHLPLFRSVLTETPLIGIGEKVPDFIWLAKDSGSLTPVLVEIESPAKRWFNRAGDPTHDLTQALNQLTHWQAWFNRPENVLTFYSTFDIPDYARRDLHFSPEYVLIYGRRSEFDETPQHLRNRELLERHGLVVMTFDALTPRFEGSLCISARRRSGRLEAVHVPATLFFRPGAAEDYSRISGLAEAIMSNDWICRARREFLVQRLRYWNEWARGRNHGIIHSQDRE